MGKLRPKEGKKELPTVPERVPWDWPSPRFSDFQPIASSSHHSFPIPLPHPHPGLFTMDSGTPSLWHCRSSQAPLSGAWECGIHRRKGQRWPCLRGTSQGRGPFSFETGDRQDLLTSLGGPVPNPLIWAKALWPPQQACHAMPSLVLGPGPTRSSPLCVS